MPSLNFSLETQLGMVVGNDLRVKSVNPGGQAESLGVKSEWVIESVSVAGEARKVSNNAEFKDVLKFCRELGSGHAWCAINFREGGPTPTVPAAAPRSTPAIPARSPARSPARPAGTGGALELSPDLKSCAGWACAWFAVKWLVGPQANEWVASVLSFSVCTVIASTVGFDLALFGSGLLCVLVLLRLLELFFGHGVYDLIVLGLIAAYHTKPEARTFDGRPIKEMMAHRKEIARKMNGPRAEARKGKKGLDGLFDQVLAGGKQLVAHVVADVADLSIAVRHRDLGVLQLAEAVVSETDRTQNIFYVGAFNRWLNVNAKLSTFIVDLDKHAEAFLKQTTQAQPQARRS